MENSQETNIKVCGHWKKAVREDFIKGKFMEPVMFAIDNGMGEFSNGYFLNLNRHQMKIFGEILNQGRVYVWVPDNQELILHPENAKSLTK